MVNTGEAVHTNGLSTEAVIGWITQAKQQLVGPNDDLSLIVEGPHTNLFLKVYALYQNLLTFQELFDFEDLLFRVVKILEEDKSWRKRVQKCYSHIFVDEFQDINDAQYRLLRALATPTAQVCVIGDPDQAIYGFRGSDVGYFKRFIEDYKRTRVIRLMRNYRSTETLLTVSFQVIENHQVKLLEEGQTRTYSDIEDGPLSISVLEISSAQAEAVAIGRTIEQMVGGTGFHSIDFEKLDSDGIETECGFSDFAILCRTGNQVQAIVRKLVSAGIPCQMVSRRTLQQPAVAKLLAAFRVVTSQGAYADVNLLTDLSAPGISKETLSIFKQWAYARQLPLTTALHSVQRLPIPKMSAARQQRLVSLVRLLDRLKNGCSDLNTAEAIAHIASETTLSSKVEAEDLDRLTTLALPFGNNKRAFGANMAIDKDTDLYQPGVEKVSVMTLHAAKGLEFPVVFVAGCEDNIIPYRRPGKKDVDVEEERRLFYVGMTRAGRQLFLS
jgi:DNA helicase II / ATP-dependent DNA helicase PcrA